MARVFVIIICQHKGGSLLKAILSFSFQNASMYIKLCTCTSFLVFFFNFLIASIQNSYYIKTNVINLVEVLHFSSWNFPLHYQKFGMRTKEMKEGRSLKWQFCRGKLAFNSNAVLDWYYWIRMQNALAHCNMSIFSNFCNLCLDLILKVQQDGIGELDIKDDVSVNVDYFKI